MIFPRATPPSPSHTGRNRLYSILVLCAAGCGLPGQPDPADRPVRADQVESFPKLYAQNCAGCHGAGGTLGPAPPLADPLFLAIIPDEELTRVIENGRPGTPMPAFAHDRGGPLTDSQVKVLAEGLKKQWGKDQKESGSAPAYLLSEGGNEQHGAEVFARACSQCHGAGGKGGKHNTDAIHDPTFLALISDQALRRYVITGRPDLGMPDYATPKARPSGFQPLTSSEVSDLVALLASWRSGEGLGAPQD